MRTKLLQTKKHFVCNNSLLRAPVSDTYNSAYQLVFIYIKTKIIKAETLKKKKEIKKKNQYKSRKNIKRVVWHVSRGYTLRETNMLIWCYKYTLHIPLWLRENGIPINNVVAGISHRRRGGYRFDPLDLQVEKS